MAISKKRGKHPYAAIEHRVIDSDAYVDLSFSARSLLVQIARQLTIDNNGHLQATHSYLSRYGFSNRTVIRGIAELIAHGMIYRARSGGYQQGAAQYAVTWLPIKRREGIYLDGFKPCAWRDWPPEKVMPNGFLGVSDLHNPKGKNGTWTSSPGDKFTSEQGAKSTHNELVPCSSGFVVKETNNPSPENYPNLGENTHGKNEAQKIALMDCISTERTNQERQSIETPP